MKTPAKRRRITTEAAHTYELVTPEGVDLRLKIGGYGERAAAFALDGLIILGVLVAMTIVVGLTFWATTKFGADYPAWGNELLSVIWMLGFFALRNFYFVYFELRPGAATPGKRALGLRVASRSGGRLTADAVFARNVMREIKIFLPLQFLFARSQGVDGGLMMLGLIWSGVFVIFPLFNAHRLRLGDLAAGTMVIKTQRQSLRHDLTDVGWSADLAFTDAQLDAYGIKELQVLEQVLRQNNRRALAEVSMRIRKKIGWTDTLQVADQAFLRAYYEGLRGRLEKRLLFGHRRVDKFDKP
jgi:uncharacterized RDD family membrane protein YckC